jgi:hypothetical protein
MGLNSTVALQFCSQTGESQVVNVAGGRKPRLFPFLAVSLLFFVRTPLHTPR